MERKAYVGTEVLCDVSFCLVVNWKAEEIKKKFQDNIRVDLVNWGRE
jgi:hypothetical protein